MKLSIAGLAMIRGGFLVGAFSQCEVWSYLAKENQLALLLYEQREKRGEEAP